MVSIKDVAERADCSTATVSYVLNKTRKVRPETTRRVMAAVQELGYAINYAAQNLAAGRSHILGLVISDILNPFFPEVIRSFQDQALLQSMDTLVMHTNYDSQRALIFAQRLLGSRVPGVAVLTTEICPQIMRILAENKICAVYLDHGDVGPFTSKITIDYSTGIAEAIGHLKNLGHEKICFLSGPSPLPSARARLQAFEASIGHDGDIQPMIVESDFTVQGGYFATAKLLAEARPTAIVASNDLMAIGAMHCAFDRNIRVPQELSIIGFDNIAFAQYTQPALTTIDQESFEIGRMAFESLREMMGDPGHQGREILIRTRLIQRYSTAQATSTESCTENNSYLADSKER